MLFHTWPFLMFMLVVMPVFLALRRTSFWIHWLLLASYVFYGWWNPYYLILIVYSTALDFFIVLLMDHCPRDGTPVHVRGRLTRLQFGDPVLKLAFLICGTVFLACLGALVLGPASSRPMMVGLALIFILMTWGALFSNRRIWLIVSLINNLALLVFFKYAGFFTENLNHVLHNWLHVSASLPEPYTLMPFGFQYLLPVGISFYTFQSLSYSIDFYLGNIQRERSFVRFATFVSFFPQLVAGPIERSSELLPQFYSAPRIRRQDVTDGVSLFLVGLFKKLALANYLSYYVDRVYDDPGSYQSGALILATVAFAWQIFFDFSGYTDMARGVARIMGFKLMLNFNNPYLATGLGDFWSRWHISLSTWFRDYVYIPLGGSRGGKLLTYRNLFLTLLISAVWHGAAWTFVIWGALHAVGSVITRELERSEFYRERVPRFAKQLAVFAFVCFAWIFFRALSLDDALLIVKRIFTTAWSDPYCPLLMLGLMAAVWFYQFLYESHWRSWLQLKPVRLAMATGMILYLLLFSSEGGAFIYFQF